MNTGRTVFAQLMDHLPLTDFRQCVARYRGDYRVQSFRCLDQFLTMAFAQLTHRESLRDIETCLGAMRPKLYHMGFRCGTILRTTLAHANETRDARIYQDFAGALIATARTLCGQDVAQRRNSGQLRGAGAKSVAARIPTWAGGVSSWLYNASALLQGHQSNASEASYQSALVCSSARHTERRARARPTRLAAGRDRRGAPEHSLAREVRD